MAGEEQVFLGPWMGILNSIIPILELVMVASICGLIVFIVWKRQPFKPWGARVLIKHRRGNDFTPEFTDGRREKNKEKQWGYKLRNGDWVPAQLFKDLRPMGKKAFLELWEDEAGKYTPAPSPFENKVQDPDAFTQADTNWLIDQFKNDIQMFTKKSTWQALIPILVPAVTIVIVILALVLYQSQVMAPLISQAESIASSNSHSAEVWQNVTSMWAAQAKCSGQAVAIPTGG
jgi:hypothetical protein